MIDIALLVFLGGLFIGSFLNVVIARIDDLRSIFLSRSICPNCKQQLGWRDLIPVVSFMLLRAKCRHCSKPISWQYPLVEVGTAFAFMVLVFVFGLSWGLLFYALIFSILIVVFVHDFKTQMVPEEFVWAALILSLLGGWYFGGLGVINMLFGAILGGGVLGLLVLVSKEQWMGSGDVKIGAIMGALLGYPTIIFGLFAAFVIGSVVGLAMMVIKKKGIHDALPFAPFLITSLLLSFLIGDRVVGWYLSILNLS